MNSIVTLIPSEHRSQGSSMGSRMVMSCSLALLLTLVSACTSLEPVPTLEKSSPREWYAPTLAHQGQLVSLQSWWAAWDEPILTDWIGKAQEQSPTLAQAQQQVLAARALRVQGFSALLPQIGLSVGQSRSRPAFGSEIQLLQNGALQASWETGALGQALITYGGLQAQERASKAGWHEARVLVAAELAQNYFAYLFCQQIAYAAQDDARALEQILKNNEITERAGFTAPATLALSRASAAQAQNTLAQQQAQCDKQIKALVALTGLTEPEVRQALAPRVKRDRLQAAKNVVKPAQLSVQAVPASVLAQRPDIYRAAENLLVAGAQLGVARAALLPSLSFTGYISKNKLQVLGVENQFNTWSVGPLSITLPLFNRAGLYANIEAAKAGYEAAGKAYTQTVRTAVREVEQALVSLASLQRRQREAQTALEGYSQFFEATEARYRVGLATLVELEEARRLKINAQIQNAAIELESVQTWIALYLALGGGFDPVEASSAAS